MAQSGHIIIDVERYPEENEIAPNRETGPLRMMLSIVFLVSCAQLVDAQHIAEQNAVEYCGDPIPNTQNQFCTPSLRSLANSLNPYGTVHPDILRKRYATHSICAICPCGVDPVQAESDADQLAKLRAFLAISPQSRLDSAVEAGDLRFLGVPDFVGLYVPCYGYRANPDVLHVIPQTLNVQLSNEHAELNRRAYLYARQYNHLLVSWLVCSEDIPLPEATRRRLGIRCTK